MAVILYRLLYTVTCPHPTAVWSLQTRFDCTAYAKCSAPYLEGALSRVAPHTCLCIAALHYAKPTLSVLLNGYVRLWSRNCREIRKVRSTFQKVGAAALSQRALWASLPSDTVSLVAASGGNNSLFFSRSRELL